MDECKNCLNDSTCLSYNDGIDEHCIKCGAEGGRGGNYV